MENAQNELVILFIPKDEEHWIEGSSEELYGVPADLNSSSDRALLVVKDCSPTADIENAVEEAVDDAGRVYVALHGGSSNKDTQKEMVGTNQASVVETYNRSLGDQIYEAFDGVIEGIPAEPETIGDETSAALDDLIGQLVPNWELEAKLEMLHRCLTLEGAKRANDPFKFREELRGHRATLISEPLTRQVAKNGDTKWNGTVGDVVSALAKEPNGDKIIEFDDSSDSRYQEALGVLRDTLLQEE